MLPNIDDEKCFVCMCARALCITLGNGPSGPTLIVVKTVRYRTNSPQTWVSYKKTVANGAIAPIGGFAFAIQPHREVRPESGLVGIVGNTYK